MFLQYRIRERDGISQEEYKNIDLTFTLKRDAIPQLKNFFYLNIEY